MALLPFSMTEWVDQVPIAASTRRSLRFDEIDGGLETSSGGCDGLRNTVSTDKTTWCHVTSSPEVLSPCPG